MGCVYLARNRVNPFKEKAMRKVLLILALLGLMAAPAWAQCGPGGCAGGSCP
jgi:hypothetical protein